MRKLHNFHFMISHLLLFFGKDWKRFWISYYTEPNLANFQPSTCSSSHRTNCIEIDGNRCILSMKCTVMLGENMLITKNFNMISPHICLLIFFPLNGRKSFFHGDIKIWIFFRAYFVTFFIQWRFPWKKFPSILWLIHYRYILLLQWFKRVT